MTSTPPYIQVYRKNTERPVTCLTVHCLLLQERCLKHLDWQLDQITQAGAWAILTCRSKWGAGALYTTQPSTDVFHNDTLRNRMQTMWQHVAARYKNTAGIAAYEVMSEPRDKTASAATVREFYDSMCGAVHSADSATPCMVGPGLCSLAELPPRHVESILTLVGPFPASI